MSPPRSSAIRLEQYLGAQDNQLTDVGRPGVVAPRVDPLVLLSTRDHR